MSNVKTINLTGGETEVNFTQKFMCFCVQNLGSGDVYASTTAGMTPEADGVITIGAGASARVSAADLSQISTLYLTGSGKVQIVGCYSVHSPFMRKKKGGDENYVVLADLPLKGSLDGYGYSLINKGVNTDTSFTDDGLQLSSTSWLFFDIANYEGFDTLIVDVDFTSTAASAYQTLFEIGTSAGNNGRSAWYVRRARYNSQWLSVYIDGVAYTQDFDIIEDNDWHHLKATFYNNMANLSVQLDNNEPVNINYTISKPNFNGKMIVGNGYNFSTNKYVDNNNVWDGKVKNLKITTPKKEEVNEGN